MHAKFYTVEKLGERQSLTPEGFLLCEGVPVARTGMQLYGDGETPIPVGKDGSVQVTRDEDAVFSPVFMASLNGKPVVNDHPDDNVNPGNWRELAVGHAMNPRRGSGLQSDLLVMDIIITDSTAIDDVRNGKREISLGYDAEYDEIEPPGSGKARQYDMVGNHIALVDAARCGPRCAIGDKQPVKQGVTHMGTKRTNDKRTAGRKLIRDSILSRLKAAVLAKDAAEEKKAEDELEAMDELPMEDEATNGANGNPDGDVHVHLDGEGDDSANEGRIGALEGRVDAHDAKHATHDSDIAAIKDHLGMGNDAANEEIEGALEEEAPPGTGDSARRAKDSAFMADSFQEAIAGAEILAPGIHVPTFDRAMNPRKTYDALCKLRRSALDLSNNTPEGRGIVDQIRGGRALDGASCGEIRTLFRSAVAMRKQLNNSTQLHRNVNDNRDRTGAGDHLNGIASVSDLNKRNAEFYARKVTPK